MTTNFSVSFPGGTASAGGSFNATVSFTVNGIALPTLTTGNDTVTIPNGGAIAVVVYYALGQSYTQTLAFQGADTSSLTNGFIYTTYDRQYISIVPPLASSTLFIYTFPNAMGSSQISTSSSCYWDAMNANYYKSGVSNGASTIGISQLDSGELPNGNMTQASSCSNPNNSMQPTIQWEGYNAGLVQSVPFYDITTHQPAELVCGGKIQMVDALTSFSRMMSYVRANCADEGAILTHHGGDVSPNISAFTQSGSTSVIVPYMMVIYNYNWSGTSFSVKALGTPIVPGDVISIFAYFNTGRGRSNIPVPSTDSNQGTGFVSQMSTQTGTTDSNQWVGWIGIDPDTFNTTYASKNGSGSGVHYAQESMFVIWPANGISTGQSQFNYGDFISLVSLGKNGQKGNLSAPSATDAVWVGKYPGFPNPEMTSDGPSACDDYLDGVITNDTYGCKWQSSGASSGEANSVWMPRLWMVDSYKMPSSIATGSPELGGTYFSGLGYFSPMGSISSTWVLTLSSNIPASNASTYGFWQVLDQNCNIPIAPAVLCCNSGSCQLSPGGTCTGATCSPGATVGSSCTTGQSWCVCSNTGDGICVPASSTTPGATTDCVNCCSQPTQYYCSSGQCISGNGGSPSFSSSNCNNLCGTNFQMVGGSCTFTAAPGETNYPMDPTCGGQGQAVVYQCDEAGVCKSYPNVASLPSQDPYYWDPQCQNVCIPKDKKTWYVCNNGQCVSTLNGLPVTAKTPFATTVTNCCDLQELTSPSGEIPFYKKVIWKLPVWLWLVILIFVGLFLVLGVMWWSSGNDDSDSDDENGADTDDEDY